MKHRLQFIRLSVALIAFASAGLGYGGDDPPAWRAVSPDELRMTVPRVEPDADAEAIFWEVWIDDKKLSSISYEHYVRVKIFTERGRDKFSKFDIPFTKGKKIEDIAARVIRPDGSITELDPKEIFEREIVKAGRIKVKAKSFAVPTIGPGVIVEYRYREIYTNAWGNGIKLLFQQEVPIQTLAYHVRPQKGYSLNLDLYNSPPTKFVEDPAQKGFFIASMSDVPAYREEPNMPPEDEVRRWGFVGYGLRDMAVWRSFYRRHLPWLTTYATPTGTIKKKAAELIAGATTHEERLERIYNYVQRDLKNVTFDRNLSKDERDDLKDDYGHAEDVIKRKLGNVVYLQLLFAALSQAAGYEVNLVFAGDRNQAFFLPDKHPFVSFVHFGPVAVRIDGVWRCYSPGVPFVPFGYVPWFEEGVAAMFLGEQNATWQEVKPTRPDRSPSKRTANFTLSADGTLEGKVKYEYFGQQAIARRSRMFLETDAERRKDFEEEFKGRISTAEISELAIDNVSDPSTPLTYSFRIRIPNYAQVTGQRLFFQPGFFEYGVKPLFSEAVRKNGIHFRYAWSETDEIDIQLPAGFELDSADQPAPIADVQKIGSLKVTMVINRATNLLKYKREFYFGASGAVLFPASSYPAIKGLFDDFHRADSHVISMKARK